MHDVRHALRKSGKKEGLGDTASDGYSTVELQQPVGSRGNHISRSYSGDGRDAQAFLEDRVSQALGRKVSASDVAIHLRQLLLQREDRVRETTDRAVAVLRLDLPASANELLDLVALLLKRSPDFDALQHRRLAEALRDALKKEVQA